MLVTESPDWDAPKPTFSMKANNKLENSGNQGQINHRNWSLFLSLNSMADAIQSLSILTFEALISGFRARAVSPGWGRGDLKESARSSRPPRQRSRFLIFQQKPMILVNSSPGCYWGLVLHLCVFRLA